MFTKLRTNLAFAASLASLLVTSVVSAQMAPVSDGRPVKSGFALQTSLVSVPLLLGDDDLVGFPAFEGGLTFGYKFDRVMIGVGFDFSNWSDNNTVMDVDPSTGNPITVDVTRKTYSFVVYPELQVALARSADHRAELLGSFSVGLGTWDSETTRDPDPSPNPTNPLDEDLRLRVRWRVAPGVRYWVHPHVGMSLVTGIAGNHMITEPNDGEGGESLGLTGLYTQIGLVGVF